MFRYAESIPTAYKGKIVQSGFGVVIRPEAKDPRYRGSINGGARDLSLLQKVRTGYGAHTPSYFFGTLVSVSRSKRPGSESDH